MIDPSNVAVSCTRGSSASMMGSGPSARLVIPQRASIASTTGAHAGLVRVLWRRRLNMLHMLPMIDL